ncbi:sensor histidine kinase [Oryzobacter terrae]|uniref:sensor histidine kinase n=1 Tax=Oryzobacter terrae TaxID=1620385 RepID=UPI00366CE759
MTLRRRLLVGVAALAVVLAVAGAAVVVAQRAYLVERLDAQLAALARNPRAILLASARAESGTPAAGLSDVYVGRMGADGRLVTVLAPAGDPALVPSLAAGERVLTPAGRSTLAGESRRVRVVTAELPNGRAQAVLALPTTPVDLATRRLVLTLGLVGFVVAGVLGLLLWWVDRLGLRPVAQMTEAADAIRAGDTTRRVPPGPPGTEVARLAAAFNALVDSSAATNERMRRFVADASHELRTPLTTLQGYVALHTGRTGSGPDDARRPAVDPPHAGPEVADALRRIGAEAARMRRLVDGLLDLARLDEAGAGAGAGVGGAGAGGKGGGLRREPVDLAAVVRDVAADLRVVAPDRAVSVEGEGPLVALVDRDLVTQALVGLTSNAVRHTSPGTPVRLALRHDATHALLEVADDGPGIPPEHLPHVFERFHRVDRGRASSTGGTGLGLALVEAVARAHGGTATVRSEPGRGATFTVLLPLGPH